MFGRVFRIFLVIGQVIYEQRRIHSFPTWDLFCYLGQAVLKPCWLEIDMLGPGKTNPVCPWYGAFQHDEESSLWVFSGGCSHVFAMDVVHLFLLQLVLASRRQYWSHKMNLDVPIFNFFLNWKLLVLLLCKLSSLGLLFGWEIIWIQYLHILFKLPVSL